ncbi:MAG TPA: sporulation integral membrane protein YtvI [Clostridiaceae bacterium]|nr:sporulation integral membrane protein YtvI [Clostridiaceae bacterium]
MSKFSELRKIKLLRIALALIGVLLALFLIIKVYPYVIPFIIAFIIASIIEPIIRLLMNKAKIPRRVAAPVILTFFILAFALIITLVVARLIQEIRSIYAVLPQLSNEIYAYVINLINRGLYIFEWLPKDITGNVGNILSKLYETVSDILNKVIRGAYITAASIPQAIIFTVITIVSTYFIASDRERISAFFSYQLPEKWINQIKNIITNMFSALVGYIKAQCILMAITFFELFIGFNIIGVSYSLLLAFIISVFDAFPIFGVGGFLIPWAIYSFFTGSIRMGISLFILYFIVLIVRQTVEPKILGNQIGVHPLVTLIAMYTGLKLLGFIGLILGPITALLFKNIISGMLRNRPLKEFIENKNK